MDPAVYITLKYYPRQYECKNILELFALKLRIYNLDVGLYVLLLVDIP